VLAHGTGKSCFAYLNRATSGINVGLILAPTLMARTALYLRVSTGEQTTANQRRALEAWAARAGHEIVAVYEDAGVSGTRGRDQRPGFDRMLKDATRRRFAMLAAWSVDRLGRSLQDLVQALQELRAAGVDLFLHQQALDTSTPSGRAMFQMLGVFAEFERAIIVERVNAGLARARAEGKRLGRPRVTRNLEDRIRTLRLAGTGIKAIARQLGCGIGTVQRVDRELRAPAQPQPEA
jgi:DNA invertase Pin-like site-specific DNA recombinase